MNPKSLHNFLVTFFFFCFTVTGNMVSVFFQLGYQEHNFVYSFSIQKWIYFCNMYVSPFIKKEYAAVALSLFRFLNWKHSFINSFFQNCIILFLLGLRFTNYDDMAVFNIYFLVTLFCNIQLFPFAFGKLICREFPSSIYFSHKFNMVHNCMGIVEHKN